MKTRRQEIKQALNDGQRCIDGYIVDIKTTKGNAEYMLYYAEIVTPNGTNTVLPLSWNCFNPIFSFVDGRESPWTLNYVLDQVTDYICFDLFGKK